MVVSEKSMKRLREFLTASIKVKHRFESLESFHGTPKDKFSVYFYCARTFFSLEYANELEIAEFYEAKSDLMLLFLLECYLLMIGKVWVLSGNSENEEKDTIKFAFGLVDSIDTKSAFSDNEESEEVEDEEIEESTNTQKQRPYVDKLVTISKKVHPTNSDFLNKWMTFLQRETKNEEFLKFPIIFTKLLQYVSIGRILSSPLAPFLVGMIKRLLHKGNLPILRTEGLKMLLNLLKAASHEPTHPITLDCTIIFSSLINIEALKTGSASPKYVNDACEMRPIVSSDLSEYEGPVIGVDLEMLNEILSFITWDLNPDLLSTKFLYNLLKDSFLSKLFPIAYKAVDLHAKDFDVNVRGSITELVIDYFALWFLKSGTKTFKFGSSLMAASSNESVNLNSKNQFGSMVSLVVNDLSNFLGVGNGGGGAGSTTPKRQASRTSMLTASASHGTGKNNEFPIASFLLEEVVLGSKRDVLFVHLILKSACYTLSYASNLFSIKLTLEIFRSWLFNPSARRPQFLQDSTELDGFIEFYLDSLEGLFPNKHLKAADMADFEGLETTLVDRVDVYREAVYFFRAIALQAFFSLSFERWLQLLRIEIELVELLLEPENLLERPFFTTEDALLAETLLGSLMRSCEYFLGQESMRLKWKEASRVLAKCSGCRGVIEEWCRVFEALAVLLVKDVRYTQQKQSADSSLSRSTSVNVNLSPSASTSTISTGSLPPTTSSFSAWPDLPSVKTNAVVLFRNILRILGDPAGSLAELRLNRPDLMASVFESMERCLDVLMKCRLDQPVKIPLRCVPPIGDFLPPALSALLHLKSYNSIISVKSTKSNQQVAHDSSRIISWKILGTVMFRPMDVVIPDHYWGALLVVARDCLNQPLSAAEFSALMYHVGVPISMAQVPGTTLILSELVDGILRFFNDTLWSGNSSTAFSASEASILIPVTMTIISNSFKLAKLFPERFGHFRDEACLLRLIKMLIGTISDGQLLTTIHTALAEIYCSECVTGSGTDDFASDGFAQNVLELMLDTPFKFSRGKSHVHVVNCLCEYISALAHLKTNSNLQFNDEFILKAMIEAVRIGSKVEEYSEALVRIIQGPLSDWILYAYQGRLSDELKGSLCEIIDLRFVSSSVKVSIDQFAVRLLTFSSAFPGFLGPKFIGSEAFDCAATLPLIHLALTPSQTLLSFESDSVTGDIYVISRNSLGKFIWKMRDFWSNDATCEQNEISVDVDNLSLGFEGVLDDSEFPAPHISQLTTETLETPDESLKYEMTDVLKNFLLGLKEGHPEIFKNRSNFYDSSLLDENWKEQFDFESDFKAEMKHLEGKIDRFERKRPMFTSGRFSVKLRLLLSSLSLTLPELYTSQPGFGIEVLKSESAAVNLDEEFRSLDGISGRFKIKIGCIYMSEGISDESELFNPENITDYGRDYQNYRDFLDNLVEETSNSLYTPQMELEIEELTRMKREIPDGNFKKHLGNDSVVVIWHGVDGDTLIDRAPFKSDVTSALIRIRSHGILPGWCIVTLQTCYERLIQPRKYARVRVDPFTLAEIDEQLELEVDGVFFGARGSSVQREGILVPIGSVGAVVRALACAAWRQAYLINCIRSATTASSSTNPPSINHLTAKNRLKYSPDIVRRDRIEEIIKRHGMAELSYEKYLSGLFQN